MTPRPFRIRPVEWLTIAYAGFNLIYLLLGWNRAQNPRVHLVTLSSIILALLLLSFAARFNSASWIVFLRRWHPLFLLPYLFPAATQMHHTIFPQFLDPFFQRIDYAIFGCQPTVTWGLHWDNWLLQELMHAAYASFYVMIYGTGAILIANRRTLDVDRFVFTLAFLCYCCYFFFLLLPVAGGRAMPGMHELTNQFRYGPFTRLMAGIYRSSPHWGGAFPSSHVAVAVGINLFAVKTIRRFGRIMLPITALLVLSTVYCHYHYFIDAVVGLLYGIFLYLLAQRLIARIELRGTL